MREFCVLHLTLGGYYIEDSSPSKGLNPPSLLLFLFLPETKVQILLLIIKGCNCSYNLLTIMLSFIQYILYIFYYLEL